MLPAARTYTDGTVVNWDEKTIAGKKEPEHPAPAFFTTAADDTTKSTTAASETATLGAPDNAASVWGIVFGAAGLLLGGTALGMVLTGRRRAVTTK